MQEHAKQASPRTSALRAVLGSARSWSLIAALSARLSGFIASFVLARLAGAFVLGQYSTVANTAGTAAAPFLSVLSTAGTFHASHELAQGAEPLGELPRAYRRLAFRLGFISCVAFPLMYLATATVRSSSTSVVAWGLAAGVASVFAQLQTSALQGVAFGAGRFRQTALASVAVFLTATACVVPAVMLWGSIGALAILPIPASVYAIVLFWLMTRGADRRGIRASEIVVEARRLLRQSIPLIGTTLAASAANWLALVFLLDRAHGAVGVGLIAIGSQWLTLMVLAATSWGSVTIKALSEAARADDGRALRVTRDGLLRRNLLATAACAVPVFVAAHLIAEIYGLSDSNLVAVLRINACTALVMSCTNVFERLLFCLGAQHAWFRINVVGYALQCLVVAFAIPHGIAYAALGPLTAAASVLAQAWWSARPLSAHQGGSQ